MAIRSRASVQLLRVVQLAYTSKTLDSLVSSIRDFDDPFTSGLRSNADSRIAGDWEAAFRSGDSIAFVDMLGAHCLKLSFSRCLDVIASPAHYCNSAGFAVWANKSLLIHSSIALHGHDVFWPGTREEFVCA